MRQTSFEDFQCSLARALEAVGDWWSPLIVRDLAIGVRRFDELVEDLGISRNLLTDRLTTLIDNGVVERRALDSHATHVEYVLTPAGNELVTVLMVLTAWGDRWVTPVGGPPIEFHHHGHKCKPAAICLTCLEPIDSTTVTFRAGPGGKAGPGTKLIGTRMQPTSKPKVPTSK
jgi:DNA-binding HxlR family transcriptional regulator